MLFELSLQNRSGPQVSAVRTKIDQWRIMSTEEAKLVRNLYAEHFSPKDIMDNLVGEMIDHASSPITAFKDKVFEIYQQHPFKGQLAVIPPDVEQFGFAATRWSLENALKSPPIYHEYFDGSNEKVNDFLNQKALGGQDSFYPEEKLTIKGDNACIWITWNDNGNDPFGFIRLGKQEEIYNALALTKFYIEGPVFLFKFHRRTLEKRAEIFRATIFDAVRYPHFKPPEPGFKDHGYTDPHNDSSFLVGGEPLHHDRRPEAIISGKHLTWKDSTDHRQFVNR